MRVFTEALHVEGEDQSTTCVLDIIAESINDGFRTILRWGENENTEAERSPIPAHIFQHAYLTPKQGGIGLLDVQNVLYTAQIASLLECGKGVQSIYDEACCCSSSSSSPPSPRAEGEAEEALGEGTIVQRLRKEAVSIYQQLQSRPELSTVPILGMEEEVPSEIAVILKEETEWDQIDDLVADWGKVQHRLNQILKKKRLQSFISQHIFSDPVRVTRIFSAGVQGEALILTIPAWPELQMSGNLFVHALRLRFGLPLFGLHEMRCFCTRGGAQIDTYGYHLCNVCNLQGNGRHYNHDMFKSTIMKCLAACGFNLKVESSDTLRLHDPFTQQRTDILITNFSPGQTADLDVSITDSLRLFEGTSSRKLRVTPNAATADVERRKKSFIQSRHRAFWQQILSHCH